MCSYCAMNAHHMCKTDTLYPACECTCWTPLQPQQPRWVQYVVRHDLPRVATKELTR